jgi:membrane protein implicated in regulation of membrane protease activity
MHPYIILLLLPLIGIAVFWLLPASLAIPVYLVILVLSGLMYWAIVRAIKKSPKSGAEGMIGAEAKVVSKLGPQDDAQYLIKVHGELWRANSSDELKPGELVGILSVDGLTLLVGRTATIGQPASQKNS